MKIFKITVCYFLFACGILIATFYQSCKQVRNCNVISNMYGTYFNEATDNTILDSSTIKATDFGIAVAFQQNTYQCKKSNGWMNEAYANSPSSEYYNLDTVTSLIITSNQNFDALHPAGTSLNEYFTIPKLDEFNISNNYIYQTFGFNLYLNQAPADNTLFHTFTVTATTQSSNVPFSYTYEHVKLIP